MALTPAERQKQYRERNREKYLAAKKKAYEDNIEQRRAEAAARMREYRAKNPEKNRRYCRNWYNSNKDAARAHKLKSTYGLTPEQVEQMITEQGNKCALCRNDFEQRPVIDHNHRTGKVRGIICCPCNRTLLKGRDNIEYLQKAIDYLRRYDSDASEHQ